MCSRPDCVLLPLNIRLAPVELAYVLNDSGARFLFVEQALLPLAEAFRRDVPGIERIYLLDGAPQADWQSPHTYEQLIATAAPFQRDLMAVDENALAELFYTSGTSDAPRGVMLTHRNIYLHALSVIASGRTSRELAANTCCDSVVLHTIPLFHANGWGSAHTVTLVGGTHVMVRQFVPAEVLRLIEQEKVTTCSLVPTMAIALVNCPDRGQHDVSSLRSVMIGGAASAPTLVREVEEKLGCACISGYGLTETSPVLTVSPIKKRRAVRRRGAPSQARPRRLCHSGRRGPRRRCRRPRCAPRRRRRLAKSWPAATSSWTATGSGRLTA